MSLLPQSGRFFNELLQVTNHKDFNKGRALHAQIVKSGCLCIYVANSLISLYSKSSNLPDARLKFQEIIHKDVVSWNCLINAHTQDDADGSSSLAAELFKRMRTENVLPNAHTLCGIFTAAAKLSDLSTGQQAHALAIKIWGFRDEFVGSTTLNMYCKVGFTDDARRLFDGLHVKNSFTWATMISGYATRELSSEALELFMSIQRKQEEEKNAFIFTSVLSALVCPDFLQNGKQIHGLAVKNGLITVVSVANALVSMYSKTGALDDALLTFQSSIRNSITWSAMVTGLAQSGRSPEALQMFSRMQFAGITPTEFSLASAFNACSETCNAECGRQLHGYSIKMGHGFQKFIVTAMIDMYAKSGIISDARKCFEHMNDKDDTMLWTSMITGCVQNGEHEEAMILYRKMDGESVGPNDLTMAGILKACSSLPALEQGKQVHARVIKHGFRLEVPIGSAILTMYAKCGCPGDGKHAFRTIPSTAKDTVAWNAVISALSRSGNGGDALELFEEMLADGTRPDSVTFLNVLSACSHLGLIDRSLAYFRMMCEEYCISPLVEHYACIVDTLGRSGRLFEAKELIESSDVNSGVSLWRILLAACRNHRSYVLGVYAGEKLVELGSLESSSYVMLASIYSALGRASDVERVYNLMKRRNVVKDRGCSWIELKTRVHVFLVGEIMHDDIVRVRTQLHELYDQMMDHHFTN